VSVPLVRVVRSGLVESVHLGDVAVCDAEGRLVASIGDPNVVAFARSCMKPFQAAVSLAAIDVAVPDTEVAVMCSSHNGEPVHVRAVRSLLRRGGLTADALLTPPDLPSDTAAAIRARRPSPIFHGCSGNHAGILVASARAGWPTETYRSRGHSHHRRMLPLVRELSGEEPVVGVDGCGIPVHGLPLRAVATMSARAVAADHGTLRRAIDAMRAHPYLVGGRDRDDTTIMQTAPGLIAKEGAEAIDCVASGSAGLGIAVKVADGGYRAVGPATVSVLRQLDLLPKGSRRTLRPPAGVEPVAELSRERS
jgi:L-asparaginase II